MKRLTPSAFSVLPASLRQELLTYLLLGNTRQLSISMEKVLPFSPELVQVMETYITNFNYQPIIDVLDVVDNENKNI